MNQVYVSYVMQSAVSHVHHFEILNISRPTVALYADNTSEQVVKWAMEKQAALPIGEKLIILHYFNISNLN